MKFEYLVHGANESTLSKLVELNGEHISASVPSFEVELVSKGHDGGSVTYRFVGADVAVAKKKFIPGLTVTLTVA